MTPTLAKPLTNLQYELLKFFQYEVQEQELMDIKQLLAEYFAKKTMDEMDKHWQENNLSNETMDAWLNDEKQ